MLQLSINHQHIGSQFVNMMWAPSTTAWAYMTKNPWGRSIQCSVCSGVFPLWPVALLILVMVFGNFIWGRRGSQALSAWDGQIVPGCSCHGNKQSLCVGLAFCPFVGKNSVTKTMLLWDKKSLCLILHCLYIVYASVKCHFNSAMSVKGNSEEE